MWQFYESRLYFHTSNCFFHPVCGSWCWISRISVTINSCSFMSLSGKGRAEGERTRAAGHECLTAVCPNGERPGSQGENPHFQHYNKSLKTLLAFRYVFYLVYTNKTCINKFKDVLSILTSVTHCVLDIVHIIQLLPCARPVTILFLALTFVWPESYDGLCVWPSAHQTVRVKTHQGADGSVATVSWWLCDRTK